MYARGVPVVGTSDVKSDKSPEAKAKREAASADALAKAKAIVEAEQKKAGHVEMEAETNQAAIKDDVAIKQEANFVDSDTKRSAPDREAKGASEVQNNKRAREEDDDEAPGAKKVDTKDEPLDTNGHSG